MEIAALMRDLVGAGIRLALDGDKLRVQAPRGALTGERQGLLRAHRDEVIAFLRELALPADSAADEHDVIDGAQPMSHSQEHLWITTQVHGANAAYNMPVAALLERSLSVPSLRLALQRIVQRHDALRTSFAEEGGQGVQRVARAALAPFAVVDLSRLASPERDAERAGSELRRLLDAESACPFDLGVAPLLRMRLLRLAPQRDVLAYTMHHMVSDGWSLQVFDRELMAGYATLAAGRPLPPAEPAASFVQLSAKQRRWLSGEVLEQHQAYWREQTRDLPPTLGLPTMRARARQLSSRGALTRHTLPDRLVEQLREFGRRHRTTLFATLLAALKLALARYARTDDVVVGTVSANRDAREAHGAIGYFATGFLVRTRVRPEESLLDFVQRVATGARNGQRYQNLPLERAAQVETSLSHSKWYEVLFSMQVTAETQADAAGTPSARMLAARRQQAKCDLSIAARDTGRQLQLVVEFISELYSPAFIDRLLQHVELVLEQLVTAPGQAVAALPALCPADRLLLSALQPTSAVRPAAHVLDAFEQRCAERANAIAVVDGPCEFSYAALAARTDAIAAALAAAGVAVGAPVLVSLPRSCDLVATMLALWQLGAMYVPLDPEYPAERAAQVIADAAPVIAVCAGADVHHAGALRRLDLSRVGPAADTARGPRSPALTAYTIYTSGSTGRPKGVRVSHASLAAFVASAVERYGFDADSRILQFATPNFDTAFEEIVGALVAGARLVLRSDRLLEDFVELGHFSEQHGITVWDLPTAYWQLWIGELQRGSCTRPSALRTIVLGGERVDPERIRHWQQHAGPARPCLLNSYGPTEATVVATVAELDADRITREAPIGLPLAHVTVQVLDDDAQPVPVGVEGELYLGGDALADGYHGLPAATAAAFVPDPSTGRPGARLYRTGDRVFVRDDGELEFVGRCDQQLKIRGFRVEPAEVTARLLREPQVLDATVQALSDPNGQACLVGYVVLRDQHVVDDDGSCDGELRATLWREHLAGAVLAMQLPRQSQPMSGPVQWRLQSAGEQAQAVTALDLLAVFGEFVRRLSQQAEVSIAVLAGALPDTGAYIVRFSDHGQLDIDAAKAALAEQLQRLRRAGPLSLARIEQLLDGNADPDSNGMLPVFRADRFPALGVDGSGAERAFDGLPLAAALGICCAVADPPVLYWRGDRSSASGAERNTDCFRHLLAMALAAPTQPLGLLPMLPAAHQAHLLEQFNRTPATGLPYCDVAAAVFAQIQRTPQVIALDDGVDRLDYAELGRRADRVAAALNARGFGRGDVLGICLPRDAGLVVVLLGVLRSGAAYAPLDPGYPRERLAMMVEDGGVACVISVPALHVSLPAGLAMLDRATLFDDGNVGRAPAAIEPGELSHIIYTSGSTGRPKAVAVSHGATLARLAWSLRAYSGPEMQRVLFSTSLNFDLSVYELWAPLIRGGCLLVVRNILALIEQPGLQPTLINTVPSAARTLLASDAVPTATRVFNVAGEPLPRQVVNDLLERGVQRVCNLYGPSEDTTYSTGAEFNEPLHEQPSIGTPLDRTRAYVVDDQLQLVPLGVAGELLLGGDGQSRGYLGRPALTAEKFVPDPFGNAPGARVYRTGDLVRYRENGALDFVGRVDHQVKVNGFRIELGEIDACLRGHPLCRDVLVLVRDDDSGVKRLLAYVVADADARAAVDVSVGALRAACEAGVPPYMVPADFVLLERFPLLPNGKIDRAALPSPSVVGGAGAVPPRSLLERQLLSILAEVLERDDFGVLDDFFRLGGNSLLAARAVARIRQQFKVDWSVSALFATPTVAGAGERLRESLAGGAESGGLVGCRATESPAASTQYGLWVMEQLEKGGIVYNVPLGLDIEGTLVLPALRRALQMLLERQDLLRVRFSGALDAPTLHVEPTTLLPLPVVDLSALRAGEKRECDRLYRLCARQPIDLGVSPLLRGLLVRGAKRHRLVLVMPHLVTDGTSLQVLADDLWTHYADAEAGLPFALPAPAINFCDYALSEPVWFDDARRQRLLDYWCRQLAGAPSTLQIPTDWPRPARQTHRGECRFFSVAEELRPALDALCAEHGLTRYMVLLGAFGLLVSQLSGQDDLVLSTPVANRPHRDTERLIGMFISTVPLRMQIDAQKTVAALFADVRATALAAFDHAALPLDRIIDALHPEHDTSRAPFSQVMFSMDHPLDVDPGHRVPGLRAREVLDVSVGTARFDLLMHLEDSPQGLAGFLEYNSELFLPETAARLLQQFDAVLRAVLGAPDTRIGLLSLWSDEARGEELHDACAPLPVDLDTDDLASLFRRQARATPDAPALEHDGRSMSYGELDQASDAVAACLQAHGIVREDRVGLSLPRDAWMLVAVLGVLKAGACYVPLDPGYPPERLQAMAEDAAPRLILCAEQRPAALAAIACPVLPSALWSGAGGRPLQVTIAPQQLAYVIFTSGSTGRPKVVGITHGNALARVAWSRRAYSDEECERVLAGTSLNFDLSVFEMWAPWSRGGCVLVVDNVLAMADRPALRPSLINSVPSAVRQLVNGGHLPDSVLALNVAGEPLPRALVNAAFAAAPLRRISNLYGPSEDTTYSTGIDFHGPIDAEPSIGRPLDGGRAVVLDQSLQALPRGVTGELFLGGPGVARGYLGRPAATAERFLPDPFGPAGSRLYKTGDRVRRRRDGELDYLGRLDHQVKLRGFRVELGDIDACLRQHPGCRDALVSVRGSGDGAMLVAHVESDGAGIELERELLEWCRAHLPPYMVPAALLTLPALPMTPNGKIDRSALPVPQAHRLSDRTWVAPRPGLETRLAAVWARVLQVERVGRHDDFFSLGGHSLRAMTLVARIREELDCALSMVELFAQPVLQDLAALLMPRVLAEQAETSQARAGIPRLEQQRSVLSFGQQRLWTIEQMGGGGAVYVMPLALRMRGPLDLPALRRSLQALVCRHRILRSRILVEHDTPVQVVDPMTAWPLPVVDVGPLEPAALSARFARFAAHGFALDADRFLRGALLRLADRDHVLMLSMPHIASDAWSLSVLMLELARLYPAFQAGGDNPLLDRPVQYADYAVWQQQRLAGPALDEELSFWRAELAGLPAYLPLPTSFVRPAQADYRGAIERFIVEPDLMGRVRHLASLHRTSPGMVFATVLFGFLHRLTGSRDIAIGMPVSNRDHVDLENVVGFFANTAVLRSRLAPELGLVHLLPDVAEGGRRMQAHAELPFEKLVETLRLPRSPGYSPVFQVLFNYLAAEGGSADDLRRLPGLDIEAVTGGGGQFAKFDLTVFVSDAGDSAICGFEYRCDLYSRGAIRSMLAAFEQLLHAALESPGRALSKLPWPVLDDLTHRPRRPLERQTSEAERAVLADLRGRLRGDLPDYMLPSALVVLDALPLNAHGKLAVSELPLPDLSQVGAERFEPPQPGLEQALAAIWSEVLRVERIGRHDSFFALGGHSLLAMQLVARVRERLSCELSLVELFAQPTLAAQAGLLSPRRGEGSAAPAIVASGSDDHPASFAQRRLWFIEQMLPGSAVYAIPAALELTGALDLGALRRSVLALVARHELLRSRFVEQSASVRQQVLPLSAVPLPVFEATPAQADELARRWLGHGGFDLAAGEPMRAALVRLSGDRHWLLLQMHHIVSDGGSMPVLWRELSQLYREACAGRPCSLPALPVQYGDYARWQQDWLAGERLAEQERYWLEALAGAPQVLRLPTDRPRPAVPAHRGALLRFELPASLRTSLLALCEAREVTLFMLMLAPFAQLLGRLAGEAEVLVGTPMSNRRQHELEGLIGLFVDTLVLRVGPDRCADVASAIAAVRTTTLGAYAHQDLPFERLVERLNPERDPQVSPLFQVMYSLDRLSDAAGETPAGTLQATPLPVTTEVVAKFDLSLNLVDQHGRLRGEFCYDRDLFDAATIQRWVEHYLQLLQQWTDPAAVAPVAMRLLDADAERALARFHGPARERADDTLPDCFERQVALRPNAQALVYGDCVLDYATLNRRANRLAHHLRAAGVAAGERVAIVLPRGIEQIVAVLGVLKCGAAYVPVDPDHPHERQAWLLADSAPAAVIAADPTGPACDVPVIAIDALPDALPEHDPVRPAMGGDALAYVIHTSGSTGRPKGVMVEQRSVLNLWAALEETVFARLGADARVALNASLSFDASLQSLCQLLAGRCLLPVPAGIRADGAAMVAFLSDLRVDAFDCTPAQLDLLLAAGLLESPVRPRAVLVGGEAIAERTWRRLASEDTTRLYNVYGPTECTVDATLATINGDAGSPHIGRPLANTRVHIVDAHGRPVPIGVVGELWLGGAGLARGYLDRPALTAERFLADPFAPASGERLYRTGDLGRWRADGTIEYLGRADFQFKLRGYRIEAGEIEAALVDCGGIAEALVQVREMAADDRRLVAWLRCDGEAPDIGVLATALANRLPAHMQPSAYVIVDAWPLTGNGKVDRAALPLPDDAARVRAGHEPPQPGLEQALAAIWSEVLRVERIGRHDSFFALGGHSLLAMQLVARVRERLSCELSLVELFAQPRLAAQATMIAPRVGALESGSGLVASGAQRHPASFAQWRLWFIEQMEVASGTYAIPSAVRLGGRLDLVALRRALSELVRRHAVLRSRFIEHDDTLWQDEQRWQGLALPLIEVTARSAPAAARDFLGWSGFDLECGGLFRAAVLRVSNDEHWLLLQMHHIVSDGWSVQVVWRELSQLYLDACSGRPWSLPPLPLQYGDYARWQQDWLAGERLAEQETYWVDTLRGASQLLGLPTDRPRSAAPTQRGDSVTFALPSELRVRLHRMSQQHEATLFMLMLAPFAQLLGRLSGQREVLIGTPVSNRRHRQLEGLIGLFVNTLVLRLAPEAAPSVAAAVARVRSDTLAAFDHQDLPFERLVELMSPPRESQRSPLFQVMYSLDQAAGEPVPAAHGEGLQLAPVSLAGDPLAKFELSLSLVEHDDRLTGQLDYDRDLFDRSTIEAWVEHYLALLERWTEPEPCRPLEMPLLAVGADTGAIVNPGAAPRWEHVLQRFAEIVQQHRDRTAVLGNDGERVSFAELDRRARTIACALARAGVEPGDRVIVSLPRSPDLIAAMLGIWQCGAAYVPLDPDYPVQRAAMIIADAEPRLVLCRERARHAALAGLPSLDPGALASDVGPDPLPRPLASMLPAYLIYTSGSTGRPKGVTVPHAALAAFCASACERYGLSAESRVLQFATPNFDTAFEEILGALLSGATLVLRNDEVLDGFDRFEQFCTAQRITVASLPTSYWQQWVVELTRGIGTLPASLDCVIIGGERVEPHRVSSWQQLTADRPRLQLYNSYGPTETAVVATVATLDSPIVGREAPIGRPLPHVAIRVLDRELRPVPAGMEGDLYLAGIALAHGYRGLPARSADAFVPDPFAASAGARMYRTGDRVLQRPDGQLEYRGREDEQLKVRGFRVEPAEIAEVLMRDARVSEVVIRGWRNPAGDLQLCAYLVLHQPDGTGSAIDGEQPAREVLAALQQRVQQELPSYMQPGAWVPLAAMPINAHGKIDREALPSPSSVSAGGEDADGELEQRLAAIWQALLQVPRVGRHDSFFTLGGHSLLAIRMRSQVQREIGVGFSLAELFRQPTVAGLASLLIDQQQRTAPGLTALASSAPAGAPVLVLVHAIGGDVSCYRELAVALQDCMHVHAIASPLLDDPPADARSLRSLAADYLQRIVDAGLQGPLVLGGWSLGGLVACCMTELAQERGLPVATTVVIDSYLQDEQGGDVRAGLLVSLARDLGIPAERLRGITRDAGALDQVLAIARQLQLLPMTVTRDDLTRRLTVMDRHLRLCLGFAPKPLVGGLLHVGAGTDEGADGFLACGELHRSVLEGDHFSILRDPVVQQLAHRLRVHVVGRSAGPQGLQAAAQRPITEST